MLPILDRPRIVIVVVQQVSVKWPLAADYVAPG